MQALGNLYVLSAAVILLLFLAAGSILLGLLHLRQEYEKRKESCDIRSRIIDEDAELRHEYNNLFQTVLNLSEEEDGLSEYQAVLTEKIHKLNGNSIAQMGKIKSDSVLRAVYRLYRYAEKECIKLNIFINQAIRSDSPREEELYMVLKRCLSSAAAEGDHKQIQMRLGIRENELGLYFSFDCPARPVKEEMDILPFSDLKIRKRITYNTFHKEGRYIQEVMIKIS